MALLEAYTSYGTVVGQPTNYQASTIFKGIPFAKPPVGKLRWRAPEKPEPWETILEANRYGSIPLQKRPDEGSFYRREFYPIEWPSSEDCLYLNVITPAQSADEKLPVALWIYGGAFVQGYSNKLETDGEAFAQRGVVYVSFNYRVGPFGFLSCPNLDDGSENAIQDNCGLLDQVAALDWVRENIAAFGGDPDHITIFGQSAGAMSVYDLMCSPLAKGKIVGAVMESGGGPTPDTPNDTNAKETQAYSEKFIEFLGGLDAARQTTGESIMAKWLEFLQANPTKPLPVMPIADGKTLPKDMVRAFREGDFANVPCIIGTVTDEDKSNGSPTNTLRDGFLCGTLALCEKQTEPGRIPAYQYHITNCPPGDEQFGAFHSSEHMYIFQTFLRSWRPYTGADFDLSNTMCGFWTNFMKTGDPNGNGLPKWSAYASGTKQAMRFDRAQPCEMVDPANYDGVAQDLANDMLGEKRL